MDPLRLLLEAFGKVPMFSHHTDFVMGWASSSSFWRTPLRAGWGADTAGFAWCLQTWTLTHTHTKMIVRGIPKYDAVSKYMCLQIDR